MSNEDKKNDEAKTGFGGFGGFSAAKGFGSLSNLGQSLRKQAVELGEKATSQVSELNVKVMTSSITASSPKQEAVEAEVLAETPTKTPENVSKEELLDVLQKMNKKVKALTSQRTQLAERCKAAETDKSRLLNLVQEEILNGDVNLEAGKDQIDQLLVAWRAADERNSLALQELQAEYKKVALQVQGNVAKVKEAAEQESAAKAEGIRADAVAEAMATGNEAWEEMRQHMVLRQREESAILRQQLHEQYDLQLAQQQEDFRQKLQEEVAKARAEHLNASPPADLQIREDIETLNTKHKEEMEKIKAAAAAQLNSFKKKVAIARTAELEKLKVKYLEEAEAANAARLFEVNNLHQIEIESLRAQLSINSEFKQSDNLSQSEQLVDLRRQYEAEMTRVKDEAEKTCSEKIDESKRQLEEQFSLSMDKRLKEQEETFREEMDRVLSVSSEQLTAMERESECAAERIASAESALQAAKKEIKDLKATYAQQIESIQTKNSSEMASIEAAIRQEMERNHKDLLKDSLSSATSEAQAKLDEEIAAQQHKLADFLKEAVAEKEQMRLEMERIHNEKLLEASILATSKAEEEVASVRRELEIAFAKQRQDLENAREAEVQRLKIEAETVAARALDLSSGVSEAQQKLDDAIAAHKQELERIHKEADARAESLKKEMEQCYNKKLLEASIGAASRAADEVLSVRQEFEAQLDVQRINLDKAKDDEILRLTKEAEIVAAQAQNLSDALAGAQKNLDDAVAAHKQELAKVLDDTCSEKENLIKEMEHSLSVKMHEASVIAASRSTEESVSLRNELEAAFAKQREELENNRIIEIRKLKEEAEIATALALEQYMDSASSKFEALRSQLSQQISEYQQKSQSLEAQLEQSQRQQESLQGELQDLKAKGAAADQDKAAILAAARDGEESSGKKLEHALEQQRASFDEQLATIKDRYFKEMQGLEVKIHEALEARSIAEINLSNIKQEFESLRGALSATEQKLRSSTEMSKNAEEEQRAEFASLKQLHKAEIASLNEQLAVLNEDYKMKLTDAYAARSNDADIVSKLQEALHAATSEIENLKKEHASELSLAHENFTKQLSESNQMLTDRATEALQLSSISIEAEEKYANLQARHEELTVAFSTLQEQQQASSAQTSFHAETLVAQNEVTVAELSKSLDLIESMKTDHNSEIEILTSKMTAHIEELSEEKMALATKLDELKAASDKYQQSNEEEFLVLQQKVKDSDCNMESINASYNKALEELQIARLNQSADADQRVELAQKELLAAKDAEMESLKAEYDEKLAVLAKKNNAAVDLVKKMKAASAQKIQVITRELNDFKEQMPRERIELESRLKAEIEANLNAFATERETMDEKIKSMVKTHDDDMRNLEAAHCVTIDAIRKENEELIVVLRQEQSEAAAKLAETASLMSNHVKTELTQKLQATEENHKKALVEAAADKQKALAAAKIEKEEAVKAVLVEYEGALAKSVAEKLAIEEKIQQDLDNRLKSQGEEHSARVEDLKKSMEAHADKLQKHFQDKMATTEAEHTTKCMEIQNQLKVREDQLAKLVGQVKASSTEMTALREEKESIHNKLKSEAVVQQALRKKLEEMQKSMLEVQSSSSATAASLTQIKIELEKEKATLQEQLKATIQERNAAKNKVEELSGKLSALGSNLSSMLDEKKDLDQRLQQAAKEGAKLLATESELTTLREQVNAFKLEQTKNRSLLEKLQAEKEASEQKHGQRTALAGMLEEQLAELNEKNSDANAKLEAALYDLGSKDEKIQSIQEQLDNAERALADSQNANKRANENLTVAQRGADTKKSKMVDQLQREVQSLQQQMSRKSAAAQRLIQEREAECIELRKQNKFLSQEVDKGSLSDRRIFELAAQQSNRESVASAEIEIRDKVVERLTEKLVAKDGDLASAEYQVNQIDSQVAELCRVRRREDVNLDYLKSIIVQYLSKPPGSTERGALLPVLATLLQFDDNDYKTIEEGKNKLSWWGTVAPIFIEAPSPAPASGMFPVEQISPLLGGGSAEVTIRSTPNGRPKSSLEF